MTTNNSTCDERADLELVDAIRPALPAGFAAMAQERQQEAVDAQLHLVQIRRNLVELIAAIQIERGLIQQQKAETEKMTQRLEENGALEPGRRLPSHRVRYIEGDRAVAVAKVGRGYELIEQYKREIALYREILEAS